MTQSLSKYPQLNGNWYFQTVVPEKTPESLLDGKEIQPVHPKGAQSWIFIGILGYTKVYWNILKLKLQYFGHLMQTANLLEKTLMLGRVTRGVTEDEMIG